MSMRGLFAAPDDEASAAAHGSPHLGAVTFRVLTDYDLDTVIKMLEETGYEAVELRTGNKHGVEPSISQSARADVKQRFARSKVRLLSYGTECEFHSPDAAERQRQVEIGKTFVDLAHDTGALGVKVRPNALPEGVPADVTLDHIAMCLQTLADYAQPKGVEIWVEIHGEGTADPKMMARMMEAAKRRNVGVCWNTNDTDVTNGSVKPVFDALLPWLKNVHMRDLTDQYPWHEFFRLIHASGYNRYMLCEAQGNPQSERFLKWYKALWTEYNRNAVCTA
jgi:sugar phosphate isomerase/epimerase